MDDVRIGSTKGLGLVLVALVAAVARAYFRLARLDHRAFWFDESYTALKLSGHRASVARDTALDGMAKSIAEVRQYQRLNRDHGWLAAHGSVRG